MDVDNVLAVRVETRPARRDLAAVWLATSGDAEGEPT